MDIKNMPAMITNAGFKIVSLKLTQLTVADAQAFVCLFRIYFFTVN
jgi:hypothetical protein